MKETPKILDNNEWTHSWSFKIIICLAVLYLFAIGVQMLVWQNNEFQVENALSGLTKSYSSDAQLLLQRQYSSFLFGPNPPNDANVLGHPPGYPILLAAFYSIFGESIRFGQILLSALAPAMVWLIARELFGLTAAWIAAFLTALSPQISYNSLLLLPDAFAVLPILAAVYFLILAYKKERLAYGILCGVSLGLSCWLRSNTLLLPLFFAALSFLLLSKKFRLRFAMTLIGCFLFVIAPVTVRNYVGFGSFIPISLGAGITLVEGIAEYDTEGRFGLVATDEGVMKMEARDFNRPEYAGSLYAPGGIERERHRISVGLDVVKSNPFWFAGAAARRGLSMFRFERIPVISDHTGAAGASSAAAYYLNIPVRMFQRLFITAVFLPLFVIGIILLAREKSGRIKLAIVLAVPLYFVCFQSPLHTEYRYVLAIQHFILIIAAYVLAEVFGRIRDLSNSRMFAGSE